MCSRPRLKVLLMRRTPVKSILLGSDYLILRVDTRENLGGKNRVMTVAPSLFGISWHKERWTKNKMTRFLLTRIFSVFMPIYGCCAVRLGLRANLFGFQTGIPGSKKIGWCMKRRCVTRGGASARKANSRSFTTRGV